MDLTIVLPNKKVFNRVMIFLHLEYFLCYIFFFFYNLLIKGAKNAKKWICEKKLEFCVEPSNSLMHNICTYIVLYIHSWYILCDLLSFRAYMYSL